MERSEPALVPEWLKSSGSLTGGGSTNHQTVSSLLQSDDHFVLKPTRTKSLANTSDHDTGRSSVTDRTTSSYFRRSSSSNGSYNNFGRSNRDRDREKGIHDSRDKEKSNSGDYMHRDYSDPLVNILPSRFEKDTLSRSLSISNGKRVETWPRKGADSSNPRGTAVRVVHKAAFERDFPSLGAEEREATPEIGRVSSPGLSAATQSLPMGTSAVIGGDGWTSALAEVPMIVGNNGSGGSNQKTDSVASSLMAGLNMAETLAHVPSRAHTPPQLSAGTQRLEELAIKQSRQLIPMTPSMPKAMVLNPLEKPKPKIGQQQHQMSSSQLVNHSPRGPPAKSDFSKTSSVGKLHVLKPVRERNGVSPIARDSSSPTSVSNVVNSPLAVAPSVAGSAPLRSPSNNPNLGPTTLDKRPTSQAQSRNDFFNLMRKKSMKNSSADPSPSPAESSSVLDMSVSPQGRDDLSLDTSAREVLTEKRGDMTSNGDASERPQESIGNGKMHSSSDAILNSEEEEAAFLRSLGWEESAGEDEGLTEEEINAFKREYAKLRPSSRIFQGLQPKFLVPLSLPMESVGGGGASSGFSSSDSKRES